LWLPIEFILSTNPHFKTRVFYNKKSIVVRGKILPRMKIINTLKSIVHFHWAKINPKLVQNFIIQRIIVDAESGYLVNAKITYKSYKSYFEFSEMCLDTKVCLLQEIG
jgi:outer membrane lipoprotein-sorting protein